MNFTALLVQYYNLVFVHKRKKAFPQFLTEQFYLEYKMYFFAMYFELLYTGLDTNFLD